MFDKLEKRIGMFSPEPALRDTVRFLVLHHLRANQYDPSWTDSAVRRFARELGEHLDDLLCLARADITTKRPEKKRKGLNQIEELARELGAPLITGKTPTRDRERLYDAFRSGEIRLLVVS